MQKNNVNSPNFENRDPTTFIHLNSTLHLWVTPKGKSCVPKGGKHLFDLLTKFFGQVKVHF